MKILENKLYLEFSEMLQCGFSEGYLKKAKSEGTKCWDFINDPDDKRRVLVGYEGLKDNNKEKVIQVFGNPYDYIAKTPIRALVTKDFKAEEFYLAYQFDAQKHLPVEAATRYTNEASWLNMIIKARDNAKKVIKDGLGLSVDQFLKHVKDLLKIEREAGRISSQFPIEYRYLCAKIKEYKADGYACLISKKYNNQSAAKINDEVSEKVLLDFISHPNQFNDSYICMNYNRWAEAAGYKTIDEATVGNHRRKNLYRIMGERNGNAAWYNMFGKVIHGKRPSAPMLLVAHDDNDCDLYFRDTYIGKDGKEVTSNYYYRYALIVIMDAHNDYILGYAYGETVTKQLIKAAWLDAVYHIKELTGCWLLPHQIQSDRWGVDPKLKGDLATFYQQIGNYTPAKQKVPRGKYIEQAFGHEWHNSLKRYPNYAGQNITSGYRINPDALEINKKSFPIKEEAHRYFADHVEYLRNLKKDGVTKQQVWIDNFSKSELSGEKQISDAHMLQLFGTPHHWTNTITNAGLNITIDGEELIYDIPDTHYLKLINKKVQAIYDVFDKSRVLITDGDKVRFIAYEITRVSRALKDYAPGERSLLNFKLQQKLEHVKSIATDVDNRKNTLQRLGINAASILQAGIQPKATYQKAIADNAKATHTKKAKEITEEADDWQARQQAYLDSKVDVNAYL